MKMPEICIEKTRILETLNLHSSDITTCDFDLSFRFASGSGDKKVAVCEWKPGSGYTQAPFSPITDYKYGVTKVKFISEEKELITASADGCVHVLNAEDGDVLHTLMHTNLASIRTFSYVSKYKTLITAADDGSVCIWDLRNETLKKSLRIHDECVAVVCVSNDSKILVSGDTTGFVKAWNVSKLCDTKVNHEQPLHCIPDCHDLGITQADFSPVFDITDRGIEYRFISGGNDNLLKVWKLIYSKQDEDVLFCTSELVFTIVGHGSVVTDVKFNAFGNIAASTSLDKTIRLWGIGEYSYQCLKVLNAHKRYVTTCSFSPDGTLLATGSNDKSVIIWDLTGMRNLDTSLIEASSLLSSLPSSPFKMKNISSVLQKIENLGNAINSCAFSKSDLLVAGGTNKLVRLWHSTTNKFVELSVSPLQGHQYTVNQVDVSFCGLYLASCSVDGTTVVWSLTDYSRIGTVHSVEGGIKACRFSPNSQLLATAGDHEMVCVWNLRDLQLKINLTGHTDAVSCLAFTKDSRYLASGCLGGSVRIWCVTPCISICLLLEENVHDLGLNSMDFCLVDHYSSNKEEYLMATCGNDSLVKLWLITMVDELTAKMILTFSLVGHGGDVTCVRFAPNSANIVASTATDKTARIWDMASGNCLHVLDSKEALLTCCAFSFDGSLLATGTLDKSIILWDLKKNLRQLEERGVTVNRSMRRSPADGMSDSIFEEANEFLKQLNADDVNSVNIPHEFLCPITRQLMVQPVVCSDGYTYERSAIESWFSSGKISSPMTNEPVVVTRLKTNFDLQSRIMQFVRESRKY